jgi:hypothetical protein
MEVARYWGKRQWTLFSGFFAGYTGNPVIIGFPVVLPFYVEQQIKI